MSGDGNPYASPSAFDHSSSPRLPLRSLLLGLLLILPAVIAAHLLTTPLGWLIEEAQMWLPFGGGSFFFFRTTFRDDLIGITLFAGFHLLVIALPLVLVGWKYRLINSRAALITSCFIAIGWWGGIGSILIGLMIDTNSASADVEFPDVASHHSVSDMIFALLQFGLVGPIPLFAGFAAYAWWVRRLEKKLSSGASGEA